MLGTPGAAATHSPSFSRVGAVASATGLQVGGRGIVCNTGPGLELRTPRPQGTATLVQSFERAWWYPRLFRWDGRQWVQFQDLGYAYASLPSSRPTWTVAETGATLDDSWVAGVSRDRYYAVVSYVYFEGSGQWVAEVESAYEYQNPLSTKALGRIWC